MRRLFACLGFCVLISACGAPAPATVPDVPASSSSSLASSTGIAVSIPSKTTYDAVRSTGGGAYERGIAGIPDGPAVLFFGKTGELLTEKTDRMLRAAYQSGSVAISTRYVEYQQGAGLSLRYGVITHNILVLLNENGEKLSGIVNPDAAELRFLLQ